MATLKPNQVAQIVKIDEAIAALQAKREAYMEKIRDAAPKGASIVEYMGDRYIVDATPTTALDTKRFQADHPFEQNPEFYKTDPVFSAALVKGEKREGYIIPGTTRVTVKRAAKPEEA